MSEDKHTYVVEKDGVQSMQVEFTWRDLSEYRVRETRSKCKKTYFPLTTTQLSLINRAYVHQGRLMLARLPFRSWRTAFILGKGIRRGRDLR